MSKILAQNHYCPKPGKVDEVYEWRVHAQDVREKLGAPRGNVLRNVESDQGPHVVWECEYTSQDEREKTLN